LDAGQRASLEGSPKRVAIRLLAGTVRKLNEGSKGNKSGKYAKKRHRQKGGKHRRPDTKSPPKALGSEVAIKPGVASFQGEKVDGFGKGGGKITKGMAEGRGTGVSGPKTRRANSTASC